VLNALVLFNTRYMDAAVAKLRAEGFEVRAEDVARLSPFVRHHVLASNKREEQELGMLCLQILQILQILQSSLGYINTLCSKTPSRVG
jgi:TnpA family transposase